MSPKNKWLLAAALVLLVLGGVSLTRHLMNDPDELPADAVKVDVLPRQVTARLADSTTAPPAAAESIISRFTAGTVTIRWEHVLNATASTPYREAPPPSAKDAATNADFTLVDGAVAPGAPNPLPCLHDGEMPSNDDERDANFRLAIGTGERRVKIDLRRPIRISQINSYSWHQTVRGPQVYTVYGSNGTADGFNPAPHVGTDPATCGWTTIAQVDTRPTSGVPGGRYAVSISDSSGTLGTYQFLLFCILPTETDDGMGHTFYSEIDVIE